MSDDLRTRLEQLRDGLAPRDEEATFEGVQSRRRQRRNRQRFGTGVVAIVVATAAIGFVIRAFNGSPTIPAGPAVVSPAVVSPHIGRSIKVGPQGGTSAMVAGFGKLWVAVYGVPGGEGIDQDALVEVDPQTLEITRTLGVPTVPTWLVGGGGLLATNDAIWIAGSTRGDTGDVATLVRVDPASGVTTTSTWTGADRFVDVASDGTSLWVLGQQGPHPVVTRFDPTAGAFSGDIKLSGDQGRHIVAMPGAVIVSQLTWQGGSGPCLSLASVDPSTDPTLRAEFPASPCSEENTVGLGPFVIGSDIWTAYKGITFTTVDPATATPRPVDPPPYPPVSPRSDPVASDSGVWFGDYPGGNGSQPDILTRFDPTTNTVEPTDVRIGWSVAVPGDGVLWAMGWDGSLTEILLDATGSGTPAQVAMPDLVGLDVADARSKLEAIGLQYDLGHESAADPVGTVSRQSPDAGTAVSAGTVAHIVISDGLPGNDLGALDCPTEQQSATLIYPPIKLVPNSATETLPDLVRRTFSGIETGDQIATSSSEAGAHISVSRSGATIARAFLTPHLADWMVAEVSSCSTSGIEPPQGT